MGNLHKINIRSKLVLLLVLFPTLALVVYVFIAIDIFKEDKFAYMYETNAEVARSLAAEARTTLKILQVNGQFIVSKIETTSFENFKLPHPLTAIVLLEEDKNGSLKLIGTNSEDKDLGYKSFSKIKSKLENRESFFFDEKEEKVWHFITSKGKIFALLWSAEELFLPLKAEGLQSRVLLNKKTGELYGRHAKALEGEKVVKKIQGSSGSFEYIGSDMPWVTGYAHVGIDNWVAITIVPKSKALSAIDVLIKKSLIFFIGLILITVIFATLTSRRFLKDLFLLEKATEEFSQGDLKARALVQSTDEVGKLSHKFNQMAENIGSLIEQKEKAYLELQETQNALVKAEKLSIIGEMAAGISHEMSNPLAIMVGTMQVMKMTDKEGKFETPAFKRLEGGVGRLQRLCEQIKSFVRGSHKEETAKDFSPVEMVEETVQFFQPMINASGIQCHVQVDQKIPLVKGNNGMIEQVIINLIKNAIEALGSVEQDNKEVAISFRNNAQSFVEVIVADNGPGIPEEKQKQMFTPFFTTKGKGKGTGLGLSISKRIAEENGGKLTFTSSPEEGTKFFLSLPVAKVTSQINFNTDEGLKNMKILLVDDEEDIVTYIKEAFEFDGAEVSIAADGVQGLAEFQRFQPHLVITDLKMPNLDGFEMTKEILKLSPSFPVIMVSGTLESIKNVDSKLFVELIPKPFNLVALISLAKKIVSEKLSQVA